MAENQKQVEMSLEDACNIAMQHMKAGNNRVAEITFREILASVPDHFESKHHLGLVQYNLGDIEGAAATLSELETHKDATAQYFTNYGIMLNKVDKNDKALTAFDKAIEIEPEFAPSYWNKSNALWIMERFEDAEQAARQSLEIDDKSYEAWLNLGTALARQDEKLEEAINAWEKAIEINPDYAPAWNNMGNALRDLGKLKEAEEKCRKSLEHDDSNSQAMNNLGNTLLDQGLITESEEWYRKAIALSPDYVEAHNNLSVCLMQQSRYEEALVACRYAITFNPQYVDGHINMSDILRSLGQLEEAEKAAQKAVILQPDSAEVHVDLADVLFMLDRYADAEIELNKAQELEPDTPRIYLKLSNVLERANKIQEALEAADKAVEVNPEMPEAYVRKGTIYHLNNKTEEAEESYKKALEIRPRMLSAYVALAELYQSRGDLETSKEYIEKAREISRDIPSLYLTLTKLKKFNKDDEDFKHMVTLEKGIENRGVDQAATLNFALFKAYEDLKDTDKAFEHLEKANDFKRTSIPYQSEVQEIAYERTKKKYSAAYLKSFEGKGHDSDVPIFILGMPRSGTTLTEQIISSHPDAFGAGELQEIALADLQFGMVNHENAADMGKWYVEEVQKRTDKPGYKRITDKMPGNYMRLGQIASILPNAKIIHCRRNPVDTCLSCYKQNFARGQYWSYNQEELAEHYNLYLDLMEHWRTVLPNRFLEINYEDTVGDFENQARKLIDFVDLDWNDACLEPHKQKRTVLTASKTQVIKPIYQTSVEAWKRYKKQLQPLVEGLGYKE